MIVASGDTAGGFETGEGVFDQVAGAVRVLIVEWLNEAVSELRGIFDANGFPIPANVRVTCGFPSKHARSLNRAIGEHWSDSASTDAHLNLLFL